MYYYIYMTTNLINGRKYIGQHSTEKIDDRYLGGGKELLKDIKKYGTKNFKKEILEFAEKEEDLDALERKHIAINNATVDDEYYNIYLGGKKGPNGRTHTDEEKEHISSVLKNLYSSGARKPANKGIPMSEETKNKIKATMKTKIESGEYTSPMKGKTGELNPNYGKKMTEEQKIHLSKIRKEMYANNTLTPVVWTDEMRESLSEKRKEMYASGELVASHKYGQDNPMYGKIEEQSPRYGKSNTAEQNERISNKRKEMYKQGVLTPPDTFQSSKSVECIETGIVYKSIRAACREYKCYPYQITDCCLGKRDTAKGLHWKFVLHANTVPSSDDSEKV